MTDTIALQTDVVTNRRLELMIEVVKKLTSIQWRYSAIDMDGTVKFFDRKPKPAFDKWVSEDGDSLTVGNLNISEDNYPLDWSDLIVDIHPTTSLPTAIYVVVGECGNRELKEKWNVIAYSDKKNAVTHCLKVQAASDRYYEMNEGELYYSPNIVNIEGDPNMRVNVITRTSYHVEEVMLGDHYGV